MSLLAAVRKVCVAQGLDRTYWIAYSGGVDSHVLLHLCHCLRDTLAISFRAIHVNHGLHPLAAEWALHARQICTELAMPLEQHALQLSLRSGESLEALAREQRYAVFARRMAVGDVLFTAHHPDHQAETLLLQLCRGAGPKGLSAMPRIKPFASGDHARPLLLFSQAALSCYAREKRLHWVDDTSNANVAHARNFIRHHVLPLLASRWPAIVPTIARSASFCAEAQGLLEANISCAALKGSRADSLSVVKLLQLPSDQRRLALRTWIQSLAFPLPSAKKLQTIDACVLRARNDKMPCVAWSGAVVRRYRDDLCLLWMRAPVMPLAPLVWDMKAPLVLSGQGVLKATRTMGSGLSASLAEVCIRFRKGGEWVEVPGVGRATFNKRCQQWGVPPWERDGVPLVYVGDRLVSVVGYFMDRAYEAKTGEAGLTLEWQ